MRKRIFILLLFVCAVRLMAQVTVDVKIDSMQLLVGEQTGITIDVSCNAKQRVQFPVFQDGQELVRNVEVLKTLPADTSMLNEGARMELSQKYIVTAWDSSLYYLPPFEVTVDGKKYTSKSLALKVYTVDVDTVHVDRFYGPKEEMEAPFAWEDWRLVVWASLAFVLLVVLTLVMIVSLKTGKPIIRIIRRKVKQPAHKIALEEIEKIKQERTWAQEDSKEYYTQLTDTLRTYIKDRYGFNAMEMTSDEIIDQLTSENDKEALDELQELFRTADLVKFAKYSTLINENDANLMTALEYINQTKQEVDPNQKAEEIIVTPEEKRKRATLITMRGSVVVAIVLALALLCWIVYRLSDLLL